MAAKQQSPGLQGAGGEIAGLKARYAALRQAAALSGADPGPLLEAALAELEAAVSALTAPDDGTGEPGGLPERRVPGLEPSHLAAGAVAARRLLLCRQSPRLPGFRSRTQA